MRRHPTDTVIPCAMALLVLIPAAPVVGLQAPSERLNGAIATLEQGHSVFGIISGDRSLANARSLARSDLDFIIIDMEHGPWDPATLQTFLLGMTDKAAIARDGNLSMAVTPMVRIPQNGNEMLQFIAKQALDVGAFGVMFPMISDRDQALAAIASLRYPQPLASAYREPRGLRGRSPGIASWYWGIGGGEYFARADVWPLNPRGELIAVLQIENPEGVRNIEEIITAPGVGIIFVGPSDLATQMGYGDNPGAQEVEVAIQTVLSSCLAHDVPCAITTSAGTVEDRLAQGFRVVTVGGDGGITAGTSRALELGRTAAGRP